MKKVVLTDIREMAVVDAPRPEIMRPDDVLLKLRSIGVCGSDVHYYTTGRIGSQIVEFPFSVGHECAADVVETGAAVTRVKQGAHVAVDPAVSCENCDQCIAGRRHTCRNLAFLGCPGQIEGCLAEYIVMPEASCHALPNGMDHDSAALAEPLSIGVYAVRQAALPKHASIGILGCGPIGLSVMLSAQASGVTDIYMTDKRHYRCRTAAKNGAKWTGNPDETDVVGDVRTRAPLLLDAVFECSGTQEAFDQALELLKPGGKLMIIGIPEFDRYSFQADIARRHELCLQHVRRQNECVQDTLAMISNGSVAPGFMATHHFSLEAAEDAFKLVEGYRDNVIKALIHLP